jgi:hypothetical protein
LERGGEQSSNLSHGDQRKPSKKLKILGSLGSARISRVGFSVAAKHLSKHFAV